MNHTGFLLIDKPVDWTSHDVVAYVRGIVRTQIKEHGGPTKPKNVRVGHAGTLDPFATGLLIVGIGREATKRLDEFKGMKKEYIATVQLGATSDTQDRTGTIQDTYSNIQVTHADIQSVLQTLIGKQQQIPPMYSAKKVKGKKLYELARKGEIIERQPIDIEIYNIELIASPGNAGTKQSTGWIDKLLRRFTPRNEVITKNSFTIRVSCSTGTYIRTLCHDIGEVLGTGAYCSELRRTKIGEYSVDQALLPTDISIPYLLTHTA
jgi:tRNA pseudouridine55 synthase